MNHAHRWLLACLAAIPCFFSCGAEHPGPGGPDAAMLAPGGNVAVCPSDAADPVVLATVGAYYVQDLAVDRGHVYALLSYSSDLQLARLVRVPLQGGAPEILSDEGQSPLKLALDGSRAYWTTQRGPSTVHTVGKSGGETTTFAAIRSYAATGSVVTHSADVYWTEGTNILKLPAAGGTPAELILGVISPQDIAIDGERIYWTEVGASQVMSAPLAGGLGVGLATGRARTVGDLALDADNVYWAADGTIMKMSKTSGPPVTLATGQDGPSGIAVDDTSVYWVNYGHPENVGTPSQRFVPGAVRKVSKLGGAITTLADNQERTMGPVLDDCHIYWAAGSLAGPRQILKRRK